MNVELKEKIPPKYLYHGTADRFLDSILNKGIKKMSRLYVHLSDNVKTALQVGKRHGKPVVIKINSSKMYEYGYKFYLSENKVWLTEFVPTSYIEINRTTF